MLASALFLVGTAAQAAQPATERNPAPEVFARGRIIEITDEGTRDQAGLQILYQQVRVQLLNGPDKGQAIALEHGGADYTIRPSDRVRRGEQVILTKVDLGTGERYVILDPYRLPALWGVLAFFFVIVLLTGRRKGFTAMLGLGLTVAILLAFILPRILRGESPLRVVIEASLLILFVSLYLAHGFNRRTTIAVVSALLTLVVATGLAAVFVSLTRLFGFGSEDAVGLQFSALGSLDFRGLLLGGILLGTLGVLDDIAISQSAMIFELSRANQTLRWRELYRRGLRVGREHIASLVNTLALAYAGSALPLFLVFALNTSQPFWVVANSEFVVEEVVRTVAGSLALIVAVPLTTLLAALVFGRRAATPPTHPSPPVPREVAGERHGRTATTHLE